MGLERTGGFKTVAFCEIEEFPGKVLKKHWPDVPIYKDVRELNAQRLADDGIIPDVITGGFPCQDISVAGKQGGIEAERSGLWDELCRLIGDIRPRFAIVENVSNLLAGPSEQRGGWFGKVLGDLAEIGFDAEWEVISAKDVGCPHLRERVWIVANNNRRGRGESGQREGLGKISGGRANQRLPTTQSGTNVADTECSEYRRNPRKMDRESSRKEKAGDKSSFQTQCRSPDVADTMRFGRDYGARGGNRERENISVGSKGKRGRGFADNESGDNFGKFKSWPTESVLGRDLLDGLPTWMDEPDIPRVGVGIPDRSKRLRGIGNAIVPQIATLIGQAILDVEIQKH